MTNNTIHNVPRELLADLLGNDHDKRIMAERHLLAMLANAPSPANHVEDVRAMVAAPSPAGVDGWDVAGDILEKLSAAQAIIDGLRGENHQLQRELRLRQSQIESSGRIAERAQRFAVRLRTERDQLAGLLREVHDTYRAAIHWEDLRGTMKRIDAALSAGKEGE